IWVGRCRLVHKLGQEQLPIASANTFRVPDLVAVFEHHGALTPVLIEVKTTNRISNERPVLSLKPALAEYAKTLGLPLLVASRCLGMWTLFDIVQARLASSLFSRAIDRRPRITECDVERRDHLRTRSLARSW